MKRVLALSLLTALWAFFGWTTPTHAASDLSEIGQYTNVVIFIRFADETTYQAPYDLEHYQTLFNGVDTLSVRDYYLEVSYNTLTIDSYLISDETNLIFYNDIYERSYYMPYDPDTNPNGYTEFNSTEREHGLLKRAIDFVDAFDLVPDEINLDVNGDGDIDSLSFIVSGDSTDWMDILWPHKWSLYTFYNFARQEYDADAPKINGVYAYDYTFELLGTTPDFDYQVSVPITAHETFHVLTAPDLYHYYRYDWIEPVGDWGLMDTVSDQPSHMLGYMKLAYGGWIEQANVIDADGTYTIQPLQDGPNNLYVIPLGHSGESLFLEYRDQTGDYESNTPSSGLIVYRVDFDYADEGNVYGYYLDDGVTPANEVFVFRPGIVDTIAPITFSQLDDDTLDEDGVPDLAGLSQLQSYDAIGIGTDIPLFYSDGTLIDITIDNIVEADGQVTFDVAFQAPRVELVSPYEINNLNNVHLVAAMGTSYQADFVNIAPSDVVYYTTDGTEPTTDSTLYTGSFDIDADNNHVQAIVVDLKGATIGSFAHTFLFVTSIESPHSPYPDLAQVYYYLSFPYMTSYELSFNQFSDFADASDRLMIYDQDDIDTYTGSMLKRTDINRLDNGVMMEFYSDVDGNNAYGFLATVTVHQIFTDMSFDLIGEDVITLEVYDTYIEEGLWIEGDGAEDAYVITDTIVDTSTTGTYVITYSVYDNDDELIGTITRTVDVVDTTAPTIELIGATSMTLEVYDEYIEPGTTVSDNYLLSGSVIVTGEVNPTVLGTYTLYYNVFDDAGNMSDILSRTITIVDTTAPVLTLQDGLDTVEVATEWIDASILAVDNYDTSLTIETVQNTVDVSVPGSYHVLYMVVDSSGNTMYLYRHVTVLAAVEEPLDITCEAGISTYLVGDVITLPVCVVGDIPMDHNLNEIDLSSPGTKTVMYSAVINGMLYEHVSYLFLLPEYDIEVVAWIDRRRDVR